MQDSLMQALCQVFSEKTSGSPLRRRDPYSRSRPPRLKFAKVRAGAQAAGKSLPVMLTDSATTVADLKARVLAFARERDWEQFHAPKNLSMALAAEAAELMEHFLWAAPEASRGIAVDPVRRERIEEELADVVIYALEFANMTGIDVAAVIETKMAKNARKYPVEKARGRSDKYTEL